MLSSDLFQCYLFCAFVCHESQRCDLLESFFMKKVRKKEGSSSDFLIRISQLSMRLILCFGQDKVKTTDTVLTTKVYCKSSAIYRKRELAQTKQKQNMHIHLKQAMQR